MTSAAAFLSPENIAVSPPRERSADITKAHVPMSFMVTLVVLAVTIAAGVWRIDARVSVLDAKIQAQDKYNADIKELNQMYLDQLSKTLEQQIINAGLRSTAMSLTQELTDAREKLRGR